MSMIGRKASSFARTAHKLNNVPKIRTNYAEKTNVAIFENGTL